MMSGKKRSLRLAEKQKANSLGKETETPAALLNDVVLQNIFKFLGYKDLKSVRDVRNTTWLRNSKTAWWSRTNVVLSRSKVDEYLNQAELHSCVKNYKLGCVGTRDLKGFWEHLGHSIKHLELFFYEFCSADDFRQILFTKCPNLEKLDASFLKMKTETDAVELMEWQEPQFGQQKNLKFLKLHFLCDMPLSWMELLSHFPNLEGLETTAKVDVYKAISIIRRHDPKMLRLKHIDIRGLSKFDHEDSLRLVLLDPKLSFETLRIREGIYRRETLVDILNLHAKSLKEVEISDGNACPSNQISLRQPLLNLEKLNLTGFLFTADLLRYTPNLKKFQLYFRNAGDLPKCDDFNMRIETCKELSINIPKEFRDFSNPVLQFFLSFFPNVEILGISGLNNEKFSWICERWTKLIFLEAYDSHVDDFGLLGFDPNSKTERVRNPNITNLKALQTFTMWPRMNGNEEHIKMMNGEVVLRELEELPHLKNFALDGYELKEKQIWKKIFSKYPAKSLIN